MTYEIKNNPPKYCSICDRKCFKPGNLEKALQKVAFLAFGWC